MIDGESTPAGARRALKSTLTAPAARIVDSSAGPDRRPDDPGTAVSPAFRDDPSQKYADASISANTRRAYESDVRQFQKWLAGYNPTDQVPPELLARTPAHPRSPSLVKQYIVEMADLLGPDGKPLYAPSTIRRWVTAINWDHELHEHPAPGRTATVLDMLHGIQRLNKRPTRRATPLMLDDLRTTMLALDLNSYPAGVKSTRDGAILVFAFVGARRRGELAALDVSDVRLHPQDGVHVRLRSSKTDQMGRGATIALPYGTNSATCGPCAFVRWHRLVVAQSISRAAVMQVLRKQNVAIHVCREGLPFTLASGQVIDERLPGTSPLFRSMAKSGTIREARMTGGAIGDAIKLRAQEAGLDAEYISGHSPRSGFITQALRGKATYHQVMKQTLHVNPATVEIYERENAPLEGNAVTGMPL